VQIAVAVTVALGSAFMQMRPTTNHDYWDAGAWEKVMMPMTSATF
jgi:hypothetical protein